MMREKRVPGHVRQGCRRMEDCVANLAGRADDTRKHAAGKCQAAYAKEHAPHTVAAPTRAVYRRSRWLIALPIALGMALFANPAAAQEPPLPSLDEVVEHLDDLYRSTSSHSTMTMTVVRERGTRELTLESWTKGEDDALIVIRAPAREAGTATLRTAEGLWNYAPRPDRLIRIPTGLLSDAWMGSHFTNDDLLRETSYDDDYDSELSWVTRDGTRYLQVLMTPKPDAPVVYTRILFLLTQDDWVPVRTEYYDDDRLMRTMRFEDVQTVSGRRLPMRMILQPEDRPNERTEMRYDELSLDVPIDGDLFTQRGLRRVAR